jgi:hypothetical protein
MTSSLASRPVPTGPAAPRGPGRWDRLVRYAALLAGAAAAVLAGLVVVPQDAQPDRVSALRVAEQIARANGVANAVTRSAVTVGGKGEFADLQVTVGQTTDLANQSIAVTWAWGGNDPGQHATIRNGTTIQANFLQIMQCWGDAAPDRTQCEFGGFQSLNQAGSTQSASRRIYPPGFSGPATKDPVDPLETGYCWPVTTPGTPDCPDTGQRDFLFQGDQDGAGKLWAVPFRTVDGQVFRHDGEFVVNSFYGEFDTNEIPYAVTRPDGKGFETFEAQTFRESAGLGCADIVRSGANQGKPRSCWLVVVPRGTTEVNGGPYTDQENRILQSSPLSLTNWNNRIAVKLNFQPIGQPCPISAQQRLVGGVETSAEAVLRWQPALCRNGGAVYGYSKLADAVTEGALTGSGSTRGLSFLNAPLDPETVPPDRTVVYAPMTISGISLTALVERLPSAAATPDVQARRGERITDLRLTPRLVAKLLTQSYGKAVDTSVPPVYIAKNPLNLDTDPEFLALNPDFKELTNDRIQVVMSSGVSFTTSLLWQWIVADDAARDFVAGVPDEFGMRVNPFYQGLDIPQETLPKIDPYCRHDVNGNYPNLCVFDLFPAVADYKESSRQVARGDTLELSWPLGPKQNPTDPDFIRLPRQAPGSRQVLGISDSATAARFQLVPVKLRNASGAFVGPTTGALLAGVASMRPSLVKGVLAPDPATRNRAAYPLTVVTYAASAPNQLTVQAARDYATFIRFAVGAGQTPGTAAGTLPEGYAPLTAAMRRQALAVADQVQRRVGPPPAGTPAEPPSPSSPPPSSAAPSASPTPTATPSPAASPSATAQTPVALPNPSAVAARTPADAEVNRFARYAMIVALLLGSGGLLIAPLLPRIAERLRR